MSVSLHEHRLGSLRWLVLTGPDREAFGALGEHVRAELTALAGAWPVLPRLRRHVSGPPGRDRLAAVRRATQEAFLAEWAELAAFAAGAGVQFDDLALLNLRGDLGLVDGGIGCSDLGWRRERSVVAHNEDGALEDVGRFALLTMTGIGRPPVTAFWYPGFVPANAFALTGDVLALTDGVGVDVSIEAVGYPETLLTAASLVRPGGTIANVGVHGVPVSRPMQDMWIQNVTLTMGLVDTVSIPTLLKMVASGCIPAEKMGTHSFTFAQMDEAYDVFSNAAENSALKVVITPS
jgi:hypothetical protein